jgi:hypothetical protein
MGNTIETIFSSNLHENINSTYKLKFLNRYEKIERLTEPHLGKIKVYRSKTNNVELAFSKTICYEEEEDWVTFRDQ